MAKAKNKTTKKDDKKKQEAKASKENNLIKPLKQQYKQDFVKELKKELKKENVMAVPNLEKIVINVGAGKAKEDEKLLDEIADVLMLITGQKPIITKAKEAISNFKIKKDMPIGLKVTLRNDRMWFFLDKLINIALPRTKDFRGLKTKSFDGAGNYSLGIKDYSIFPEVDTTKNIRLHGIEVSIITTTDDNEEAKVLLKKLGMPFKKERKQQPKKQAKNNKK